MVSRSPIQISIAAVLLLVGLVGGIWYLSARSGEGSAIHPAGAAAPDSGLEELQKKAETGPSPVVSRRGERRAFQIMQGRFERMSPRMKGLIETTFGTRHTGLQLDRAQYARTEDGGIWIVDGKNITCLVQASHGALACGTTAEVVDNGLVLGLYAAPERATESTRRFVVLGIAPDWAKVARLKVGSTIRAVAVRGNSYASHAGTPIRLERLER